MCGRFSLGGLARHQIRRIPEYDVQVDEWIDEADFHPRYNIAPRSRAPVVRRRDDAAPGDSNNLILHTMKWGLVPHWSKYEDTKLSTTNARSENLVESSGGMWASIKGKKRCAVVCQGYYEWKVKGKERFPHLVKFKDGRLMLMAGLFDSVILEGDTKPLWTFTIVTTSANDDFSWLHDRQPVFLSTREALDRWLDTSSQAWTAELTKMVEPYHGSVPLECYQVPKEVGKVGNESSTFIHPIENRKDGIQAMFSKQRESKVDAATTTPKRRRSASPLAVADGGAKKAKAGGATDHDSDDDVVVIDAPSTFTGKSPAKAAPASPSKSKSSPRKMTKVASNESPSKKISDFFKKA